MPWFGIHVVLKLRVRDNTPMGIVRMDVGKVSLNEPVNIPTFHRSVLWICGNQFFDQCTQTVPVEKVATFAEGSDVQRLNPIPTTSTEGQS
jgi:hypothetical protein